MSSRDEIHSPLPFLLQEEKYQDHQATDALFLTFGADYGYFEKAILGLCRSSGARVSILSDVHMSEPDVRAVKEAGQTYLAEVAECAGAFHSKLVIIVGPRRAMIAIGSGNVSVSGWQHNHEIWMVTQATKEGSPNWLFDLAAWLEALPDYARMGRSASTAARNTALSLRNFLSEATITSTTQRLVHTLTDSILSQLPIGPVDELLMYAPFHDPHESAVRSLINHFQPKTMSLAIQPGVTVLESEALTSVQSDYGIKVIADSQTDRYRHGKVIEWRLGDERWALTGSANLSRPALLLSMTQGGNCELGLVSMIDSSLFPKGEEINVSTVLTRRITSEDKRASRTRPILLNAVVTGDQLHLERSKPQDSEVVIEISNHNDDPDHWSDAGIFPPDSVEVEVNIAPRPGSRVRLVAGRGSIDLQTGNIVFVSYPGTHRRVLPGNRSGSSPTFDIDHIFSDPVMAREFEKLLEPLSESLSATRSPRLDSHSDATDSESSRRSIALDTDEAGWVTYRDEFARRFGVTLAGLALPNLPHVSGISADFASPVWDDLLVDDSTAGLSEETAEDIDTQEDQAKTELENIDAEQNARDNSHRVKSEYIRKYKAWARRLAQVSSRLPLPERFLVVKLLLLSTQSGLWSLDDDDCWQVVHDATANLAETFVPDFCRDETASLAAVAMTLLHETTAFIETTERTVRMTQLVRRMTTLLPHATPELVKHFSSHLEHIDGSDLDTQSVMDLTASLATSDPVREALTRLHQGGYEAHLHNNNVLHVSGSFANPTMVAHEAIAQAQDAHIVGAWVTNHKGDWTFMAWSAPDLILAEHKKSKTLWRHYRLTSLASPSSLRSQLKSDPLAAGTHEVRHIPRNQSFPEARTLMADLNLLNEQPPQGCT